jgi:hypothetical protein
MMKIAAVTPIAIRVIRTRACRLAPRTLLGVSIATSLAVGRSGAGSDRATVARDAGVRN